MAIVIKVAKTAKELQDVYQLRFRVYKGEGSFEDNASGMVCDHFDGLPNSQSVIAYAEGEAIGTMRVTCDSEIGLPADMHYNFDDYRNKVVGDSRCDTGCDNRCDNRESDQPTPLFLSAGMLAIDDKWRGRRDVFKSIFKIGCDVAKSWGCTHIISTVNEGTATIYRRLGFEILDERFFYEPANEYVVPVGSHLQNVFDWAFTEVVDSSGLLKAFSGEFEYLMVSKGDKIFTQGEQGHTAYLINQGVVDITNNRFGESSLHLASLGAGELIGEMALIDGGTRSANAVAVGNCELLVLNQEIFWQRAHEDANNMRSLLRLLSARVRSSGTLAHLYAHGDLRQRLEYFVNKIRRDANPSNREENCFVARITVEELSHIACATFEQTQYYLQQLVDLDMVVISAKTIKFYGKADLAKVDIKSVF